MSLDLQTEILEWENWKSIKVGEDFIVEDTKIIESFALDIRLFLDWHTTSFQRENFDELRNIIHRWWNSLLIEYSDKDLRDEDIKIQRENFKMDWKYFSQKLTWWLQIWEFLWKIDYKWKYYLLLNGLNKLIDRTDDIVFRWIIINISKFINNPVSNKIKSTESRIGNILSK